MTEEQLQEHGYPEPHPEISGHAVVHNLPEKKNNDRKFFQCLYAVRSTHNITEQTDKPLGGSILKYYCYFSQFKVGSKSNVSTCDGPSVIAIFVIS